MGFGFAFRLGIRFLFRLPLRFLFGHEGRDELPVEQRLQPLVIGGDFDDLFRFDRLAVPDQAMRPEYLELFHDVLLVGC